MFFLDPIVLNQYKG